MGYIEKKRSTIVEETARIGSATERLWAGKGTMALLRLIDAVMDRILKYTIKNKIKFT
jgi:hypothetical protein